MNKEQKRNLSVRIVSVGLICMAFAIFKPLGLERFGLSLYAHLLIIWAIGTGICYVTEAILKYVLKMPASLDKGADYIIRRNLWFQLLNSPLETVLICTYFNLWSHCLQVFLIIAFCSFLVGLYWRYKFRNYFLETELKGEETVSEGSITLNGTTNDSATLKIEELLYIEAVGNYVKIHQWCNDKVVTETLRNTLKNVEEKLHHYPTVKRCHRAFIVNMKRVEQMTGHAGSVQLQVEHCETAIPVSRSNIQGIRDYIKKNPHKE